MREETWPTTTSPFFFDGEASVLLGVEDELPSVVIQVIALSFSAFNEKNSKNFVHSRRHEAAPLLALAGALCGPGAPAAAASVFF